jgi:UDP-galactopyranose mutase
VINYPNDHKYTRITEFKHIHPVKTSKTTILKEYPQAFIPNENVAYYPVFTEENQKRYEAYKILASNISNLILVGRLAEFKYYDMDDVVERAFEVYEISMR